MIVTIVSFAFQIYFLLLIVRILSSWIPSLHGSKFIRFVSFYTDPYLNLFRRFIPPLGGIDFSPIVAILVLQGVKRLIFYLLFLLHLT